jgi:uncharacterized protein
MAGKMAVHGEAIRIDSLYLYPVKSCGGVRVSRLDFDEGGRIVGDREWAVVDDAGQLTWQGTHPRLALVSATIANAVLVLEAAGVPSFDLSGGAQGAMCTVQIWNEATSTCNTFAAQDAGAQANAWLRAVARADLRLVRLGAPALAREHVNAIHVVSAASLEQLNDALLERGGAPSRVERFRPNILLAGSGQELLPFLEEYMTALRWQTQDRPFVLDIVESCVRCAMPNVDPINAQVTAEPMNTVIALSAQRHPGKPPVFGVYARAPGSGQLHEGQVGVAVTNW